MWFASNSIVDRFDISTGIVDQFPVLPDGVNFAPMALGSDGNVWACVADAPTAQGVAKITPNGSYTFYPTDRGCIEIIAGSDGALWTNMFGVLGRMAIDGTFTEYPIDPGEGAQDITAGTDGNIWFTENGNHGYSAIAKFDISTHAITEFKHTLHRQQVFYTLIAGKDGNYYADDRFGMNDTDHIFRLKPDGSYKAFLLSGSRLIKSIDGHDLYLTSFPSKEMWKWSLSSHHETDLGVTDGSYSAVVGPDSNIWFGGGVGVAVYINRIISVTPASATIPVSQTAPFTITESNCSCTWSAKSSNPAVVSVSSVSGGDFTVTAVASGSATVTVADKKQNTFQVSITVP